MRERPHALRVFIDVRDAWSRRVIRESLGARADVRFVNSASDADVRVTDASAIVAAADTATVDDMPHAEAGDALTDREHDVLQALAEGLSNHAIGDRLGISTSTVKFHLASLFAKLGVHRRAEAVAAGVRRGDVLL